MSAEVIPFRPPTIRFGHELVCRGCSQHVYCAAHYGQIDLCLTCQVIGPEAHLEFLRVLKTMRDAQ
jgi:hypothetical protein